MNKKIVTLMKTPPEKHDLDWIKTSLQAAIELELSTIPPYLCGLWSIQSDPTSTVTNLIKGIVLEEMLHLGIVCNLLVALGGTPQILSGYKNEIKYPGPLPGGVHPGLTVYLSGLTQQYVKEVYMAIELPERPLAHALEAFPTIGAFYDAITEALQKNNPTLQVSGQRTTSFDSIHMSLAEIGTVDAAVNAIGIIKDQGEGTDTSMEDSPYTPDFGNGKELAHYYKFGEIASGKTIEQQQDGTWGFTGDPVPFPQVYHMPPVPAGGYLNPVNPAKQALADFNATFTQLLQGLDLAWGPDGSDDALQAAVGVMFELKPKAKKLFTLPLPDGDGFYGPDFLLQ